MSIKMKPVTVKLPKATLDMAFVKKEMEEVVKPAKEDFETFVSTWRAKNRPKMKTWVTGRKKTIEAFTGVKSTWTKGKKANKSDKFMFIARGTKTRTVKMSRNFKAKTKRGVIQSKAVRGDRDPVAYGQKAPGIKSRNIEKTVRKKRQKQIKKDMKVLYFKAIKRAGNTPV